MENFVKLPKRFEQLIGNGSYFIYCVKHTLHFLSTGLHLDNFGVQDKFLRLFSTVDRNIHKTKYYLQSQLLYLFNLYPYQHDGPQFIQC